jgi:hypothetical protein
MPGVLAFLSLKKVLLIFFALFIFLPFSSYFQKPDIIYHKNSIAMYEFQKLTPWRGFEPTIFCSKRGDADHYTTPPWQKYLKLTPGLGMNY